MVQNSPTRREPKTLDPNTKQTIDELKTLGDQMIELLRSRAADSPAGREFALARTKVEEAVMWGVKALTA